MSYSSCYAEVLLLNYKCKKNGWVVCVRHRQFDW
jgi:hypothetical protein